MRTSTCALGGTPKGAQRPTPTQSTCLYCGQSDEASKCVTSVEAQCGYCLRGAGPGRCRSKTFALSSAIAGGAFRRSMAKGQQSNEKSLRHRGMNLPAMAAASRAESGRPAAMVELVAQLRIRHIFRTSYARHSKSSAARARVRTHAGWTAAAQGRARIRPTRTVLSSESSLRWTARAAATRLVLQRLGLAHSSHSFYILQSAGWRHFHQLFLRARWVA